MRGYILMVGILFASILITTAFKQTVSLEFIRVNFVEKFKVTIILLVLLLSLWFYVYFG